ncbi:MAG TPA: carbohydrate binding family 9 domain-containing protein [Bacteroidota bacterium]|nr:carbohydrate binding family 9 domain-containing protein [Bacteroidota bacterium]
MRLVDTNCCNACWLPVQGICFLLIACLFSPAFAAASDRSDSISYKINCHRCETNIKLTGKLDDPQWQLAQRVEVAYEVTPGENTPSPQKTFVRTMYNSEYVYFGFDCRDTTISSIRAHITDRDKMYDDDWVMVILDTYGDYQRSYEFVVNPYGIQGDLLRTSNNEDDSFDAVWESKSAIDDSGWTAEMAIPLKSMRFPAIPEQNWVVDFLRNYPRASRVQISWTPISRDNPCLPCQGGHIEGVRDVQSTTSVDLLPYVVGQESGQLQDGSDPTSHFDNGDVKGRVGIGARYAPSPDLAVEGTINPDFSQVESDATQISVNSNYALFYPEKRPFFLLGADMFQNQTQTFYTRSINNTLAAARVIGKSGSLSFAYLGASDRNTPYIVPGEESSDAVATDISSFSNAVRARYDFGKENYLGGTIITRNATDAHNYVGGVDWNYKFWENYYFQGEMFYSDTKELNDTSILSDTRQLGSTGNNAAFNGEQYSGGSTMLTLLRNARDISFSVEYLDRAPTFQAQDGFVTNNDTRELFLQESYSFYTNNGFLDMWQIFMNNGLHYNYDGIRKEKWALPGLYFQLKSQTNINLIYFLVNDELYQGIEFYKINRGEITINSRPSKLLTLSFDGTFGKFIKRVDSADIGTGHTISAEATVRPTSQLVLDLTYSRSRLSSVATGDLFYDGYIMRGTAIYDFTAALFLRLIVQYDEFSGETDIYPLLSYKLNPYTIFYAGSTFSDNDFGQVYGMRETSRQFFLKLQYLIRS